MPSKKILGTEAQRNLLPLLAVEFEEAQGRS